MDIAAALLALAEDALRLRLPIRLRAWDGSEAGVPGAPVVVLRDRRALRHMKPLPQTIGLVHDAGLEIGDVQAMRERYPQTVAAWARNLEDHWDTAVALVGEETARVWRLYLAGGSLEFEQNRVGVDQVLAAKPTRAGLSGMPATPMEWLG